MLRVGNNNVITFNIEEAKSYDGFTGPYLQYTVSRINSLLDKEEAKIGNQTEFIASINFLEKKLLIQLAEFPEIIIKSSQEFEPSSLAQYLFNLAKDFSSYYQTVPILNSADELKVFRLALVKAIRQVLINGLKLLGIEAPKRM